MRFKSLPYSAQAMLAHAFTEYAANAPAELFLPIAPPEIWLAAMREVNVRLGVDGMPKAAGLVRVTELVENTYLPHVGSCPCCNAAH